MPNYKILGLRIMKKIKLIYFNGCPNAEKVQNILLKSGVDFEVLTQDNLLPNDKHLAFSSPSILIDDQLILGQELPEGGSACSFEKIDEHDLLDKLLLHLPHYRKRSYSANLGSIFSAILVGFCPACIPAIGAFLSSIGLGLLISEAILKPLLVVFLAVAILGYFWSYWKEHHNIFPLLSGILMAVSLYIGRYIYIDNLLNPILMYGGVTGIIITSFWNWSLRAPRANCNTCD